LLRKNETAGLGCHPETGQNFEISIMSLSRPIPARNRLPNRRAAETITFEHGGASFTMTSGRYYDGRLGEIFMNAAHANSALDAIISDAAIAVSFALQNGASLDDIRHAMKRNAADQASSPIGAALDRLTS
jgi:hypothetical protein